MAFKLDDDIGLLQPNKSKSTLTLEDDIGLSKTKSPLEDDIGLFKPIGKLGLQDDIGLTEDRGPIGIASPEQIKLWREQGAIGTPEVVTEADKSELLPFNPERAFKAVELLSATTRLRNQPKDMYTREEFEELPEKDKLFLRSGFEEAQSQKEVDTQLVTDFLLKKEEEAVRGVTIGGHITRGVLELPSFMIEFLGTGGLSALGKKAVTKGVKKVVGEVAERGVKNLAIKSLKWTAGGLVRTLGMPHRVAEQFATRQTPDITVNENEQFVYEAVNEKPFTSLWKAYGDIVIENMSEEAGAVLTKGAKKLIPKRFGDALIKTFNRLKPGKKVTDLFTRAGYHGFIEELGEEQLGKLMRAIVDIPTIGPKDKNVFERVVAAIPSGKEMLIEMGVLAVPGASQVILSGGKALGTKGFARTGKGEGSLEEQAKKYKTAEEFIENVGDITVFRGENISSENRGKIIGYYSTNKEFSQQFTQTGRIEEVKTSKINPIFIYDARLEDKSLPSANSETEFDEGLKTAKEKGFFAFRLSEGEREPDSIYVFDKKAIFGKRLGVRGNPQQLTDIFNKAKKVPKESIEEKFERLTTQAERRKFLKDQIAEATPLLDRFKGRVKRFEKGFLKEELEAFPKRFFTTKEDAVSVDEALQELREAGTDINEAEFAERLKKEIARKKEIQEEVAELEQDIVSRKELTVVKQKLSDIKSGVRKGKVLAQKEIKAIQDEVINLLEESKLEAIDYKKFIKLIKNTQTQAQFIRRLDAIDERISRLVNASQSRAIRRSIKRELKTTKPVKQGQRRIGKFDPESNRLFDTLRDYNKLNQEKAQAEFDAFPEEPTNELDLVKKRFLSLKANGASASLEIHKQVLADIQRIKKLGKQAKDEADLEKRINRQEKVESALTSIGNIKADKRTLKTKIGNIYRNGFSNIYSMLNSIAGKAFAEAYDPILNESKRNTATYKKALDVTVTASKIYDQKNIMKLFESMSRQDYQITDTVDGLTTKLSKLDLIDIYNSIKNNKKKQDYSQAFGEYQVQTLMGELTDKDEAFGDALQEAVQSYREILNKRSIEITGRDLGFVENYWPATSEFQVSVLDDMRIQGETPSALRERVKTSVIPIPKNAWYKAQKHIAQAEHVENLSREYETLKRLFSDRKVKHSINEKFGKDVYNTLMAQIDNLSLNKQTERIDAISGVFQKAINNWVIAKIALNPSTYVRQLMSVGNFAEHMNAAKWTEGFFKGISSPRETFNFVWKNAPFLEARFNKGYSEALKEAIEGAEGISVNKSNWTKFLTSFVRSGDITAIIYGGAPLIRAELAKHGDMKRAIDVFENASLKSQQSGLSSGVSQFQNSRNPFTRLFLAFKNTSNQYFRKMADNVISFSNGDISLSQFVKTMVIYNVIQPTLYVSAGFATKTVFSSLGNLFGLKDDDDDFEEQLEKLLNDIMVQMIVSPVNAMPIIDDVMRAAARKLTGQKIYKIFSTPLFDDLEKGVRAVTKNTVSGEDYLKMATSILEPATSAPIGTGVRYYEIFTGKKIFKKSKGKGLEGLFEKKAKKRGGGLDALFKK